jgi:hypothetical protein
MGPRIGRSAAQATSRERLTMADTIARLEPGPGQLPSLNAPDSAWGRHPGEVHPVSTALFLLGYGLALPIGMKMGRVVAEQQRTALAGHQIGVVIALVGWLLKGSVAFAVVHVIWLVAVRLWFQVGGNTQRSA